MKVSTVEEKLNIGMQMHDEDTAARILKCSPALLRKMRRDGRGPRWTRIGRLVRYAESWLREYVDTHAIGHSAARQPEDNRQ